MIVRILSRGSSFKGLAAYLTHDPDAETSKRVAWTHTLNLAQDHVPSAVDEMLGTANSAEHLKQEAGIRAGGRETENVVKHLSLNWAPDEQPDRAHMIESTEDFLRHMGWQDHQAVLVAHDDRAHAHVHAMINMVHPETGLRLNDDFERRRAQAWALEYEREDGRIYCEQRLQDIGAREEAPTRPVWAAFRGKQQEFEQAEKSRHAQEPIIVELPEDAKNRENPTDAEWKLLKEIQRQERVDFFAGGKSAFADARRSVYREVREEFRERWSDFYAVEKDGADPAVLKELKAELVGEQKALLEERRDLACTELRSARDEQYRGILDDQRDARAQLRSRQEAGLENSHFLEEIGARAPALQNAFHEAARESTIPVAGSRQHRSDAISYDAKEENSGMRSGAGVGIGVASDLASGLLSFFGGFGAGPAPSNPGPEPRHEEPPASRANLFDAAVEDAHSRQQREQAEADAEKRKREREMFRE